MNKRLLFVDDDKNILHSFARNLKAEYEVSTAESPDQALEILKAEKAFAAVVSDLKMPGMDGIAFLEQVASGHPNTIRVMLTGFADLDAAMNAVNKGQVFRFLTKPCDLETLRATVGAAVEQYRLVRSERVLLEKTLKGCIEVLTETLSLVNPEAYGRATRLRRYVQAVGGQFAAKGLWKYEMAAMLSQLGCLVVSEEAIRKVAKGKPLKGEDLQLFQMAPEIGRNLLERIPRMGEVARMVAYQMKGFDGSGIPLDAVSGEDIPLGGRLLRLVSDFDTEVSRGKTWGEAFLALEKQAGWYDPELMYYLEGALGTDARYRTAKLRVGKLHRGMILNQDVQAKSGILLARHKLELNEVILSRLIGFSKTVGVVEPIEVLIPLESAPAAPREDTDTGDKDTGDTDAEKKA